MENSALYPNALVYSLRKLTFPFPSFLFPDLQGLSLTLVLISSKVPLIILFFSFPSCKVLLFLLFHCLEVIFTPFSSIFCPLHASKRA